MNQKSIYISGNIHDKYKNYCNEEGYIMGRRIEILIMREMNKKKQDENYSQPSEEAEQTQQS